jgi:hypothetical protein
MGRIVAEYAQGVKEVGDLRRQNPLEPQAPKQIGLRFIARVLREGPAHRREQARPRHRNYHASCVVRHSPGNGRGVVVRPSCEPARDMGFDRRNCDLARPAV